MALQRLAFAFLVVMVVLVMVLPLSMEPASGADLAEASKLIVQKTNLFREQEGLPKVENNVHLSETAQYFADYLARTEKFSHSADGHQPAERAKQHGYAYCLVSENIAYEYSSQGFHIEELADKFVEGWKQSPEHRKNMLDPDVTDTGVAVAHNKDTGSYYAVQMFGRPESRSIRFQVVNRAGSPIDYQVGERTFTLPPRITRTHQECRPGDLVFHWPEGQGQESIAQPRDGEGFIIVQDERGQFQVKRE